MLNLHIIKNLFIFFVAYKHVHMHLDYSNNVKLKKLTSNFFKVMLPYNRAKLCEDMYKVLGFISSDVA